MTDAAETCCASLHWLGGPAVALANRECYI